jgi:DNA invertase Pin-like site-specific DNA recombinase
MNKKPKTPPRTLTRVFGYVRLSTNQGRQTTTVDAQRADIEAWAKRNASEVVAWYVDEISGGAAATSRPQFFRAIADLETSDVGAIVFQRWDRFGRAGQLDTALAEAAVLKTGAALISADGVGNGDDPMAQLHKEILQAVARFEKSMIVARIKAGLAVKRARGELTGVAPYGTQRGPDGKQLVGHEGEQATLARTRVLRAEGLSLRATIAALQEEGHLSRAGKPFTLAAMHAMTRALSCAQSCAQTCSMARGHTTQMTETTPITETSVETWGSPFTGPAI